MLDSKWSGLWEEEPWEYEIPVIAENESSESEVKAIGLPGKVYEKAP